MANKKETESVLRDLAKVEPEIESVLRDLTKAEPNARTRLDDLLKDARENPAEPIVRTRLEALLVAKDALTFEVLRSRRGPALGDEYLPSI